MEEQHTEYNFDYKKEQSYIPFAAGMTIAIGLLYSVPGLLVLMALPPAMQNMARPLVLGASQLLFMLAPAVLAARFLPMPLKTTFRLENTFGLRQILLAIIGLVGLRFFSAGFLTLQDALIPDTFREIYNELNRIIEQAYLDVLKVDNFGLLIQSLIIGAVLPAVCEEGLFRGFFQRTLEEKLPAGITILLTGLLFAIVHMNIIEIIPLLAIGIYLSLLAYTSRSIMLPVIIHFLNNASAIILLYFAQGENLEETFDFDILSALFLTIMSLGICAATAWLLIKFRNPDK